MTKRTKIKDHHIPIHASHPMVKFSKEDRFIEPYNEVPGPAAYAEDVDRPKTTSGGRIGTAVLPSSLSPLNTNPGPNSYQIQDDVSKRSRGGHIGKGGGKRQPFPTPPPTPGPNAYKLKYAQEYVPPRLKRKLMGSFASRSKRDSFIGKVPEGPGIGKYSVPTGNRWERPSYVRLPEGFHTFGANVSRYIYMGNLNHSASIPGPGSYEVKAMGVPPRLSGSRSVPRLLGKQFEKGVMPEHTFGADKDRFKDSAFGRLDLAALSPGPNAYDVVLARTYLESRAAAGASVRPPSPMQPNGGRPVSPCTFGASENRHTYAGDLAYRASTPGPGQYRLPGLGGILDNPEH